MEKHPIQAFFHIKRSSAVVSFLTLAFLAMFGFVSCDDEDFTKSTSAKLTFPSDTLTLDTALSMVGTPTYTFTIHNHTGKGIRISKAKLEHPENSGFRVNVHGTYINEPYDYPIEVRSHDSIVVMVDMQPRYHDSDEPVLVSDYLTFRLESGVVQQIVLNAYIQDVNELDGYTLTNDTVFSSKRPYLIKDTLWVAENATLKLLPGVRLFFASKAGLLIKGKLLAQGSVDAPVVFRGSRMDYMFENQPYDRIPGQWSGVTFTSSSFGNEMKYCDVHSGTYGIRCDSSNVDQRKLTIENTIIHNMKGDCMTLVNSDIFVGNTQITNALGNTVTLHGGKNHFVHCTIANFYPFTGGRGKTLYVSNCYGGTPVPLCEALFENCIILGWGTDEIGYDFLDESSLPKNYTFRSCLLATENAEDVEHFENNIYESDDDEIKGSKNFISFDSKCLIYNFHLDTLSNARNVADLDITNKYFPYDMDGTDRLADELADVGCYEFK